MICIHELTHRVLWLICFGVWIIVFFFIILISPLLPPLKNLKQSTVSVTNFYRHYKTIFRISVHEVDSDDSRKKDSAHVTPKAGGSGWIPTMSTASQHEVSQMSPSHWPLPPDVNFRKTNGNRHFSLTKPRVWHLLTPPLDRTMKKSKW